MATKMRLEAPAKRLLLMRHAKSSWKYPVSDHRRPLNERGERSAEAVGRELHEAGLWPSLVLSSDSKRTKQTWSHMKVGAGEDAAARTRVLFLPELYGIFDRPATDAIMEQVWRHAGPDGLRDIQATSSSTSKEGGEEERGEMVDVNDDVLVLGHNDGWELALNELVGSCHGFHGMPTANCYVLEPKEAKSLHTWEDIFESYGKWTIKNHIVARDLL